MSDKQPGYILHTDPLWVEHHRRFSLGGQVAYCRGAGAPMRNVVAGGMLLFMPVNDPPKRIVACASFVGYEAVNVAAAWERFGLALGATSFDRWRDLAARIESVKDRDEIGLIIGSNFRWLPSPAILSERRVEPANNAAKGWSIGDSDLEKLIR